MRRNSLLLLCLFGLLLVGLSHCDTSNDDVDLATEDDETIDELKEKVCVWIHYQGTQVTRTLRALMKL